MTTTRTQIRNNNNNNNMHNHGPIIMPHPPTRPPTHPGGPQTNTHDPFQYFFFYHKENRGPAGSNLKLPNYAPLPDERNWERSQILSSFSALTTGLALAICSLPISLKSKVQPWCSGYLWVPQNVIPHLHLNPVSPTRLLHVKHLFATATATAAVVTVTASSGFDSVSLTTKTGGGDGGEEDIGTSAVVEDDGGDVATRDWLRASLAEEDCCSVSCKSR